MGSVAAGHTGPAPPTGEPGEVERPSGGKAPRAAGQPERTDRATGNQPDGHHLDLGPPVSGPLQPHRRAPKPLDPAPTDRRQPVITPADPTRTRSISAHQTGQTGRRKGQGVLDKGGRCSGQPPTRGATGAPGGVEMGSKTWVDSSPPLYGTLGTPGGTPTRRPRMNRWWGMSVGGTMVHPREIGPTFGREDERTMKPLPLLGFYSSLLYTVVNTGCAMVPSIYDVDQHGKDDGTPDPAPRCAVCRLCVPC